MSKLTVIYDACVLYPAPVRDFLMWLALTDTFKTRWTDEIHEEWIRNVLKELSDLTITQLTRTKNLMNTHVRDCLMTDYQELIPNLETTTFIEDVDYEPCTNRTRNVGKSTF
ncbi:MULTISPECIES: hypothetical protein [unclassified Anabaena]|uniref:hypothetical protein n=1 Tax=unclassified Anabaena TaxID=2619674 RepID=UPI0039C6FB3E